jgi:DNA polymerase III subunit beta
MRLSCDQEDLHRGLSAVGRAIPARTTLPITQHILVEAEGDSITLSATDAETIAITYTIDASIEEPGNITMPSRLLADFVATLPHQPISMTLAERSRQVSLACARNTASIGGMDPDDFPPIPTVEGGRHDPHRGASTTRRHQPDRVRRRH